MLRAGGSAVDACVAAAFASWVAEPALTGPGGGGFLVAYDAARRRPLALDCFVAVPGEGTARARRTARALRRRLRHRSADLPRRSGVVRRPRRHRRPRAAHRRLGRLPWGELARPAVALAHAGVEMTPAHADVIGLLKGFLGASPEGARVFGPSDAPLRAGDRTPTRRSATRSSASPSTARANWPTARPLMRSSPTRRRPAAA